MTPCDDTVLCVRGEPSVPVDSVCRLWRSAGMKFARVAVFIVLVAACDLGRPTFHVQNHIDSAIDVWFVSADGNEHKVSSSIPPGMTGYIDVIPVEGGCTTVPLIARTSHGALVSRTDEPICGSEGWTVSGQFGG